MSRIDTVEKGLTEVAHKAHAMKVRALQVANSVPPPLYTQDAQWPALLGQFRLLSNQARDLDNVIVDVFKDYVISPTETGHGPNGEPTTLLPDMLRSRKPPEQEQSELDVINRVTEQEQKRIKLDKSRDRVYANPRAREKMIKDDIYKYDSALRSAYGSFLAEERDLTSQTKILIEDFYASRLAKPPQGGIALLSYMNSGYLGSLKEVKESTDSSSLALL